MSHDAAAVSLDDVPLSRFHLRVTAFTAGGLFCDGYILGIVGIALAIYGQHVGLPDMWLGLIGSGALIGLFLGSLIFGPIIDRLGRQTMYVIDLTIFVVCSLLHLVADEPWQLFAIRLALGIAMGIDYAIGATLLSEFLPRKHRGTLLATLNTTWTVGFVVAFVIGYVLRDVLGEDSWRWMLASGAVPAVVVLLLRLGAPESPRWLAAHGRADEARRVLDKYFGEHVVIDESPDTAAHSNKSARLLVLFTRPWRRRTLFASVFWFCQVLPYFALFTFAPTVLSAVGLGDGFTGGLIMNLFQLAGGIVGVIVMDRLARRGFTLWSFVVMGLALLPLGIFAAPSAAVIVACFAVYAFAISAAGTLCHVYPAELFPTDFRATGVGFAAAMSRIGAAVGTFLLPLSLSHLGNRETMLLAVLVLAVGVVATAKWAPETRELALQEASAADSTGRGSPAVTVDR
ncbi:arabinose efflux permease family protein [Mycolicibacterium brisbanense]|uniref:Arabinose efflux permease family protein n=2 Tax=Mycolicibacterium brisbanense TaxID=146020 RepID=A0A117I5Y1_9MYCO|nr:arabinose efflux permease family protein [Mycolicibacterium brisbanense]